MKKYVIKMNQVKKSYDPKKGHDLLNHVKKSHEPEKGHDKKSHHPKEAST